MELVWVLPYQLPRVAIAVESRCCTEFELGEVAPNHVKGCFPLQRNICPLGSNRYQFHPRFQVHLHAENDSAQTYTAPAKQFPPVVMDEILHHMHHVPWGLPHLCLS